MSEDTVRKAQRDEKSMKKKKTRNESLGAKYDDEHGVLEEIIEEPVEMSLETELRKAILSGKPPSRFRRSKRWRR